MVLLIKNNHASVEDVARLSVPPAGDAPMGRLAKLRTQGPRNAGVPKAKSLPHINRLAEGGSLKAHCAAVLNTDLHKLKPRELIARRVKSAKEDLRQLFETASPKQRVETARGPSDSITTELACSPTASNVGNFSSLNSSSSLAVSVPAHSDEQDEEDEDHLRCLTVVAQSWLDFERLFSRCRALSDQTIEEARHDLCQALVQSFSDRSPTAPPFQAPESFDNLVDFPSFHPACSSPGYSPAPSATTLANQTTLTLCPFESMVLEIPARSPEFSDDELQREFDKFSFHSSQEEEWTSEVESRKQNAMNRALSDMKRKLADPVPQLSSYLSDDSLADSAAHRTLVDPRTSCSGTFTFSREADDSSSYSADQEDEADEDDESVSVLLLDSPVCATPDVDAAISPTCPANLSLSSQMDDPTSDQKQDDPDPRVADIEDGTDNVWGVLATYVPRLLTRISEESLADEYEVEATAQLPPPSFRRPISQYRTILRLRHQRTLLPGHMDQVDFTPAAPLPEDTESSEATSSNVETSFAATKDTENDPASSSVVNPGKPLRRMRGFMDLKNPIILPTVESTSSIETPWNPSKPSSLRRVPGCLDLRRAFGGTDISVETPPSLSGIQGRSFQRLGRCFSFEERQPSSELEEDVETRSVSPRYHALRREDSAKPPIPPKPLGLHLHRKKNQLSSATIQEPSSLCSRCDPPSSLPLWTCAKITRSKGKRGRPLGESTKALKKRLDSIRIDPETIHGHPSPRCPEKFIPSINESRTAKTSKPGKLENSRKIDQKSDRDAKRRRVENLRKQARHICLLTLNLRRPSHHSSRDGTDRHDKYPLSVSEDPFCYLRVVVSRRPRAGDQLHSGIRVQSHDATIYYQATLAWLFGTRQCSCKRPIRIPLAEWHVAGENVTMVIYVGVVLRSRNAA